MAKFAKKPLSNNLPQTSPTDGFKLSKSDGDLTESEIKFADIILESYDIDKAAKESGLPKARAMSLLQKPNVAAYIKQEEDKKHFRSNKHQFKVHDELSAIAYFDPTEIFDQNSDGSLRLKRLNDIPQQALKNIKSVSFSHSANSDGESSSCSLAFHDKIKALQIIGDSFGVTKKTVEHKTTITLEQMLGSVPFDDATQVDAEVVQNERLHNPDST